MRNPSPTLDGCRHFLLSYNQDALAVSGASIYTHVYTCNQRRRQSNCETTVFRYCTSTDVGLQRTQLIDLIIFLLYITIDYETTNSVCTFLFFFFFHKLHLYSLTYIPTLCTSLYTSLRFICLYIDSLLRHSLALVHTSLSPLSDITLYRGRIAPSLGRYEFPKSDNLLFLYSHYSSSRILYNVGKNDVSYIDIRINMITF